MSLARFPWQGASPAAAAIAWAVPAACLLSNAALPATAAAPPIVIHEIMYHPPEDRDDLQWIELHNPGVEAARLDGWSFKKGFSFVFPAGTVLEPGGYLVLARDRDAFVQAYGNELPVIGNFSGRLSHGGENLELVDQQGRTIDRVRYSDREPWPRSPDGMSPSLERVCVAAPSDAPENWAPSPLPPRESPAGTPGRANHNASPNLPPLVVPESWQAPAPDTPFTFSLHASDPDGIRSAQLAFQVVPLSGVPDDKLLSWTQVPMRLSDGDAQKGTYSAEIPGQPDGVILRVRAKVTDTTGAIREVPHPDDARPAWSAYIGRNRNDAQIPFAFLVEVGPSELPASRHSSRSSRGQAEGEPSRGQSALVLMPPKNAPVQLCDYIRITPRKGGWKARLHKDRMIDAMSTINVIFEQQPRHVLAEHLAYELYRAAGVPTPQSGHWRLWRNARPLGYHLFVEQPNSSFLRRVGLDSDGDLYKLLWYEHGPVRQHEKKNNPQSGHTELIRVIDELNARRGEAQWKIIQERFDVNEFATYYAVNMCIQNWDGFFNNYFVCRAPGPDGRWQIIPWDEDKTWGDHDGASPQYDWYSMPLTFGMQGDRPARTGRFSFFGGGGGPFGGTAWWRPPGWFSGPLLANPQFRAVFLRRLRELCDTSFTPEAMEVAISRLEVRLEPEIRHRAQITHRDEEAELKRFERHITSFRLQVENRREFILQALKKER